MSKGQKVEIFRVSYISDYTSNLLSLLQLKEIGISYYNRNNFIILKKGDKKVSQVKQSWHLFILESIIRSELVILANTYEKPTYLKILIDIRQFWYRKLKHTSYIYIKYFTKIIDRIQLDCIYSFKDNNILKNNQSDEILFDSLPK